MTCRAPSDRAEVPISDALAPAPTVGLPFVRRGGQKVAHAPKQALFLAASFLNR